MELVDLTASAYVTMDLQGQIAQVILKFIYFEKATKICEISTLDLTVCTVVKFKVEISQNFVAFSEYMNFTSILKWL